MKRTPGPDSQTPFHGVRHYHRHGAPPERSWDEWVDGRSKPRTKSRVPFILGILLAVAALAGIIVGLFIELR